MPFALLFVLLIGGGATVAAENALPGDVLYPVKTSVNENARALTAFSDEAKAGVSARLAARRLEEAEALAARGEVSAEARVRLEENFKRHAEAVTARVERLKVEGDAEAAADVESNFETSLRAHESVLMRLSAEGSGASYGDLLTHVRARLSQAASARADAEATVRASANVEASAEGKLGAAENVIAEVRRFIERIRASGKTETAAEAEVKLRAAEAALLEGRAKLEAEGYAEAFGLFQSALRLAQEAKISVNLAESLGLRARATTTSTQNSEANDTTEANTNAEVRGGSVRGSGSVDVDLGL